MKAMVYGFAVFTMAALFWAGTAQAQFRRCRKDQVKAGSTCIDKYEASVWRIPNATTTNKKLVKKVQKGKATAADITAAGGTQLGVASDDYTTCADDGSGCTDVYAVSLLGVTPSAYLTQFQALAACRNSLKNLPRNIDWQAAALGTPDTGGADDGATTCNTDSTFAVAVTGSRSLCVSDVGAFDMVGNLWEWVADWVPQSSACPGWGGLSDDVMCLSGASTTANGPGALIRGGDFNAGSSTGPLAVYGGNRPYQSFPAYGFRCSRPSF